MLRRRRSPGNSGSLLVATALIASLLSAPAFAADLEVTAGAHELILGDRDALDFTIELVGDDTAEAEELEIVCSAGRASSARQVGPRRWVATYHPPEQSFPQVAIIAARAPGVGAFGATAIRLLGRTEIAFRTDPGVQVSVTVADREFGPVRADRRGAVSVEVVVPPGTAVAEANSRDVLGNESRREIRLDPPSFGRALLVAPETLVAGAEVLVALVTVTAEGAAAPPGELTASRGAVERVVAEPGMAVFRFRAPRRVEPGTVTLATAAGSEEERLQRALELRPGPLSRIRITTDREALVPGSDQRLTVTAVGLDRWGNVRRDDEVELRVAGQPVDSLPAPEGGERAVINAPPSEAGIGSLVVTARADGMEEQYQIRLVGGVATLARIEAPATAVADGRTATPLRILLVGETGLPAIRVPNIRTTTGELRDLHRTADGWWRVDFVPDRANLFGPDHAMIEVARGPASARTRIRLTPTIPWLTLALSAGLQTNAGALIGPAGQLELATRVGLRRGWLVVAVHSGIHYARVEEELSRGAAELQLVQVPLAGGISYGLNLRGRLGMTFLTRGGALLVAVMERTDFQPEASRVVVAPLLEAAVELTIGLGPGELAARVGFGWATAPEGSGLTNNLLGLSVLLGYRLFVL